MISIDSIRLSRIASESNSLDAAARTDFRSLLAIHLIASRNVANVTSSASLLTHFAPGGRRLTNMPMTPSWRNGVPPVRTPTTGQPANKISCRASRPWPSSLAGPGRESGDTHATAGRPRTIASACTGRSAARRAGGRPRTGVRTGLGGARSWSRSADRTRQAVVRRELTAIVGEQSIPRMSETLCSAVHEYHNIQRCAEVFQNSFGSLPLNPSWQINNYHLYTFVHLNQVVGSTLTGILVGNFHVLNRFAIFTWIHGTPL